MTTDATKIAAKLRQQEERVAQLTSKADALERENRDLRASTKALAAAEAQIVKLRASEAAAVKDAQAAEVRARGFAAEVSQVQARAEKLQAIVDRVAERDAADRELEALLGSR